MPTTFRDPNETFNARFVPPGRIAQTFVPNEHFWRLCRPANTLLVGTRGSGKTTLLKMLTYRALREWKHERAESTRRDLPFRAVYIPTDIQWERALDALKAAGCPQLVLEAAVTASAFVALTDALQDALEEELPEPAVGRDLEAELAQTCVRCWLLPSTRANLDGVRERLSERLSAIASLAQRLLKAGPDSEPEFPEYLYLDMLAALDSVCQVFENMCSSDTRDRRWALCFDELEIAPRWFQEAMLDKLRGAPQRFLFKLCTSPTPAWPKERNAYAGMDFDVVPLASDDRIDQDFSRDLAAAVIQRETKHSVSPEEFFGMSSFAEPPQLGRTPCGYEEGSEALTLFRELSQYDSAFSEFLGARGIDLAHPSAIRVRTRHNVLRKAKPVALLRRAYSQRGARAYGQLERDRKKQLGSRLRPTRRKVANVYHGWDVICRAGEGNPRWLIVSLALLLRRVTKDNLDERPVLSERDQALAMSSLADQFGNYLLSLGELSLKEREPEHHIWALLRHVGAYFHGRLVDPDEFVLDPPGSFTADAGVNVKMLERLRAAEFEGAIVDTSYGPDFGTRETIRGRRFRLSYRLAPKFGLLLRKCKKISLTEVMATHSVMRGYCTSTRRTGGVGQTHGQPALPLPRRRAR